MDIALKELEKLQKLTDFEPSKPSSSISILTAASLASKGKATTSVADSLDGLLASLRDIKERLEAGSASEDDIQSIGTIIDERKKEVDDRQKEVYATLGRIGKALDKKLVNPVPELPALFMSAEAQEAMERTIALHLLRTGQFNAAETFFQESTVNIAEGTKTQFAELHYILTALRNRNFGPALSWCKQNRDFLEKRSSALEFYLHRSQFMCILLAKDLPDASSALAYAKSQMQHLYLTYSAEINRLCACIIFTPLDRSPYADLASPSLHFELEPLFSKEYCASLGMSRQVPLRVVGDIGGGGALARIEKGRKVMRERKSEWSQTDELPIEIPLAAENRYHSIFACPVSKEQATPQNPPMIISCGHVLAKDSLAKLAKPQGKVKCPYCPQESLMNNAQEVYF